MTDHWMDVRWPFVCPETSSQLRNELIDTLFALAPHPAPETSVNIEHAEMKEQGSLLRPVPTCGRQN